MNAPAKGGDAMLSALAEAVAPLVAKLLKERAGDDGDDALAELLERAGYELANDGGAS